MWNPQSGLAMFPFNRWGKWGTEGLRYLSTITQLKRGRAGFRCLVLKLSYFHPPSSGLELGALSNWDGVSRTPRAHAQWTGPESSPTVGHGWQDRSSQTHCQLAALRSGTQRGRDRSSHEDTQSRGLRRAESTGLYSLIQTVDQGWSASGSLLTLQLRADSALSEPTLITDPPHPMPLRVSRAWGWGSLGNLKLQQILWSACESQWCFSVASPPSRGQHLSGSACPSHLKNSGFYTVTQRMTCQ